MKSVQTQFLLLDYLCLFVYFINNFYFYLKKYLNIKIIVNYLYKNISREDLLVLVIYAIHKRIVYKQQQKKKIRGTPQDLYCYMLNKR